MISAGGLLRGYLLPASAYGSSKAPIAKPLKCITSVTPNHPFTSTPITHSRCTRKRNEKEINDHESLNEGLLETKKTKRICKE
jgi:hypothetical protein